jgi:hypothetical protein
LGVTTISRGAGVYCEYYMFCVPDRREYTD